MDILSYTLGKKAGGGSAPVLQDKEVTITENGETTVTADSGYDGLSSVEVTTNVPSSGVPITGQLVTKTASGNITKGDFVEYSPEIINDYLDSADNYKLDNSSTVISNVENLFDNNENTYAEISLKQGAAALIRINAQCKSANSLNIPQSAKIKSVKIEFKINVTGEDSSSVRQYNFGLYSRVFNPSETSYPSFTVYKSVDIKSETLPLIKIVDNNDMDININTSNLEKYGIQLMFGKFAYNQVKAQIYYIKFIIEYENNGNVQIVSSNANTLAGVANTDANNGDTIQVYVPNTSNQ